MKRLLLGVALVAAAALSIPTSASAAVYNAYVGCDYLAASPVPAASCAFDTSPGSFFEASENTVYDSCVETPNGTVFCLKQEREAQAGGRDVVPLPVEEPGPYFVVWFVGLEPVASWEFNLDSSPPPAPQPAQAPAPPPAVLPVLPGPTKGCLQARKRVTQLQSNLRNASGKKQKARLRGKLKAPGPQREKPAEPRALPNWPASQYYAGQWLTRPRET